MERVRKDTKKARLMVQAFQRAPYKTLWDAYKDPSREKERAWWRCQELCKAMNGRGLRITSHNCQFFTAAFSFEDPETGVLQVAYITPNHDYEMEM